MRRQGNLFRQMAFLPLLCMFIFTAACTEKHAETPAQDARRPKIVSLAPSLTEMLFAIGAGDQVVGRTSACDWPVEAKAIPVTGAFGRPSLEVLASIHPDLAIDVDLADEKMGEKIKGLGIRLETISCKTPEEIPDALRRLGRLTGHEKQADSLAAVITEGLGRYRMKAEERMKAREKKTRPSVYLEIWDDPFWTGGSGSYTSALIECAGGRNIGDVVEKEYFEISQEWVIARNPDIIACMYMARETSAAGDVMKRPGWGHLRAVKGGHVYDGFDNSLFLRPGPRVLEGVERLHRLFYPGDKEKG
ncbi:MAG: cobalamin-binding protein [Pelodictyon luteolum]|uniref:ABC transporter, periplasmic substrate-binding protein n=2 Tax=Pelodictyon luteolum TaxID=1100 RepID=Q3B3S1_CHLL3|nr:cobalamin-binding protein [Pelodictyon luteolum]ABB24010.1 ABC transporter, periplasmic substrate-binding protein [Pelodictyon luteolum DSM 273]KZK75170.1 MAG: cobalamin-binding protein [Pelodictyon luteolum]